MDRMADVFLSYFNRDRKRVERIARLLEAQGVSVWRDTTLRAGEHWGEVIERELAAARCIVVCWSDGGVKSRWVREEANQGLSATSSCRCCWSRSSRRSVSR
jgi:serine/threonine-protein kinase